jgi:uncharacterized membrane protein (UPF0136 family)
MKKQAYLIWIYTAFLLTGGLIGLIKAGSLMSILMSALFSILLIGCGYGVGKGNGRAYYATLLLLSFLLTFFGYRFLMTYQAMPAGMMTLLTSLVLTPLLADRKQLLKTEG